MMFRFLLVTIGLTFVVAHPDTPGMRRCGALIHGGLSCCKKAVAHQLPPDDIKECFQMPKKPPPSCDLEICIAKKRGLVSDDGTIDKKKVTEEVEKRFEGDQDLIDSIKENCIDGDLSKYGPPDFCDLIKQKHCLHVQITKSCEEWNEEGDCNGMKELAAECNKMFS